MHCRVLITDLLGVQIRVKVKVVIENLSGQDIGVKSHDQFGSVRGELGFYRKICCKGDDQCFLVCESFKNSVRIKTGTEFQKFECLARRSSDHNLCRQIQLAQ